MKVPTRLLWLLAVVFTTSMCETIDNEHQDGKYLIYFPTRAHSHDVFNISVSIFNATADTHITAQLTYPHNDSVIASVEADIPSETTKMLQIQLPLLFRYSYYIRVNGTGGVVFYDYSSLYINRKKSNEMHHELLIQTDKPVYKPLDHVQFRVFGIYADLRSSKSPMNITMKDPKQNIMQRWINEEPKTGVSSHEYELSDKPVLGQWTIEMQQEGTKEKHHFQVKEYVLPTYKVTVHGQKNIPNLGYGFLFLDDKEIHVNVSAKYTFGKGVRGDVYLNATIAGKDGLSLRFHRQFEGEAHFSFFMRDFKNTSLIHISRYQNFGSPRKITFNAMVVEALTGKKMHSEPFHTEFVNTPIKLHLDTPIIYKRGLPKQIKIQVSRVDEHKLTDHDRHFPLVVTTTYENNFHHKVEYPIPENGTVYFDWYFPVDRRSSSKMRVVYRGFDGSKMYEMEETGYPTEYHNKHEDNIEAMLVQERVNIGDDIKIHMNSTSPISWAHITVVSGDKMLSTEMRKIEDKTDFMIEIPTSDIMIPTASVVVSCITSDKRWMVDASTAKITINFKNEVVGVFTKDEGQPGTNVDFKVKTMPGSAVFVMAVDKKLHLLESAEYITEEMVYDAILGHESSNHWRRNVQNPHDVLRSVNLNILTNYMEKYIRPVFYHGVSRSGPVHVQSSHVAYDSEDGQAGPESVSVSNSVSPASRIRKFFPETWIWQDGEAGESGEYTFSKSVPDSITMWQANAFAFHPENGLGIMKQPVDFLSHQDFFIHPELPYSLVRGESFILKVSIFSNLTTDQEVTVTLPESTEFKLNGSGNTQTVMVKSHGDNTVRFHVVPSAVGDIPIKIHASCEMASDEVHKDIIVKPEGYTLYYNKAFLLKIEDDAPVEINYEFEPRKDIVEDSERVEVSVIGDIMGPTIDSLGHLIRIPSGCGEQNMINFAPNVYIYEYLNHTDRLTPEQMKKIKMYTERGYKNQLTYQRSDGSFSAFGKKDKKGSTWLTAFVLRCFGQAKKNIPGLYIDEHIMHEGINWLVHKKNRNHTFREDGRVIHSAMQGGSSDGLALTIYVLISLIENQEFYPNITKPVIKEITENLPTDIKDSYTLATMFYLTALVKDTRRFETIEKLLEEKAISKDDMKYWETEDKEKVPTYYESKSTGIELASYVLLAYTEHGDIEKGIPIMKWLMSQRNSLGGFHSTQDTILGLEALALFAAQVKSAESLAVTVTTDSDATSYTFPVIGPLTNTILHKHLLPSETQKIHFKAVGKTPADSKYTYALVQIAWQYNVKLSSADNIFEAEVEYRAISQSEMELDVCHKMKEMNLTGMIIVEAALPSGYTLTNTKKLLTDDNVSKVEFKDSNVVLYLNELHTDFSCYKLEASKIYEIKGHLSPLPVKIRLYYKPDLELVTMYQLTGGSE